MASCRGGILAGSTDEYWRAAPARYWPDTTLGYSAETRRPLAGSSGGILGGIHWLAGCSLLWDTQCALLWRYTWQDPLARRSGGYSAASTASTGEPLWRDTWAIHWRAALAGYWAGSTDQLWRDTGRDPLISSGRILGGIHWRAALAGYSAGSTGELLWRDTRRVPLASCSGGIMGGGVVNADSNINLTTPSCQVGKNTMVWGRTTSKAGILFFDQTLLPGFLPRFLLPGFSGSCVLP